MASNFAFGECDKEQNTLDEDAGGSEMRITESAMVEQEPHKTENENMKADLIQHLDDIAKMVKIYIDIQSKSTLARSLGMGHSKGIIIHGKPGLGPRVEKYLKLRCKDIAFVFARDLVNFSPSKCDDTFLRAGCCDPCILLLIGLENADGDMQQMIAKKMQESLDEFRAQIVVIATTAMLDGVSEKLKKESFAVVDLQELLDP